MRGGQFSVSARADDDDVKHRVRLPINWFALSFRGCNFSVKICQLSHACS